jgi:hypothetical protein
MTTPKAPQGFATVNPFIIVGPPGPGQRTPEPGRTGDLW